MKNRNRLVVGLALIAVGLVMVVVALQNLSVGMDLADRQGSSGNIFEWNIAPLGVAGLLAFLAGLAMIVIIVLRSQRESVQRL